MTDIILTTRERETILGFARILNEGQEWQELSPLARAWLVRSYRTGTRARRLAGLKALRLAHMLAEELAP